MLSIVNETETKVFQQNQLTVKIYPTVQQMGKAAAQEVADRISEYVFLIRYLSRMSII